MVSFYCYSQNLNSSSDINQAQTAEISSEFLNSSAFFKNRSRVLVLKSSLLPAARGAAHPSRGLSAALGGWDPPRGVGHHFHTGTTLVKCEFISML